MLSYPLVKTKMWPSLGVEHVTLWKSSSSVSPLPPLCIKLSVPHCHLLSQLTNCSSITSVPVTCSSVEVIAACAMPPSWHIRLVSAPTAAMPIGSTETEAWQPTHQTHRQTPRRHAQSHHSLLKSQMMAQDWGAGGFSCESTWGIQWSVFSRRVEGTDAGGLTKLEGCIVHTVHTADVSSTHLLCCKRSRTFSFYTTSVSIRTACTWLQCMLTGFIFYN